MIERDHDRSSAVGRFQDHWPLYRKSDHWSGSPHGDPPWRLPFFFVNGILPSNSSSASRPAFVFGLGLEVLCKTSRDLAWGHGLVVASFSWFMATVLGAIPHYLSGHFGSYLDAMFDVMSGYTTTGLYLLQDLDHVSHGLNMWRHLLTYAGGQGIIVVALTFLFRGRPGPTKFTWAKERTNACCRT